MQKWGFRTQIFGKFGVFDHLNSNQYKLDLKKIATHVYYYSFSACMPVSNYHINIPPANSMQKWDLWDLNFWKFGVLAPKLKSI